MIDITDNFTGSDVRLKVKGSKLTRLDLLLNKLEIIKKNLNCNKNIITIVYDKKEFVEKKSGTVNDTIEILEYYSPNFIIDLNVKPSLNTIIVHLVRPINKSADYDME